MTDDTIDLSPLERAINRLDEGWARYQRDVNDLQIRDGLIQCFEFTYEISHKTLKRYLQYTSATPTQYDTMSFADLIRLGNEQGLLLGIWSDWKRYRDIRAKISHSYDEVHCQRSGRRHSAFFGRGTSFAGPNESEARMISETPPIDIQPDHWEIVRRILQTHVPHAVVWVFGSRATGKANPFSDLDIAIITTQPLPLDVSASLSDDFSESDLPYKVDVVDWTPPSASLRTIIVRNKVAVSTILN